MRDAGGVGPRESLGIRLLRAAALGDGAADPEDDAAQGERAAEQLSATLGRRRDRLSDRVAVRGGEHLRVTRPGDDVLRRPQMLDVVRPAEAGAGIGEIEGEIAADQRQAAGSRRRLGRCGHRLHGGRL